MFVCFPRIAILRTSTSPPFGAFTWHCVSSSVARLTMLESSDCSSSTSPQQTMAMNACLPRHLLPAFAVFFNESPSVSKISLLWRPVWSPHVVVVSGIKGSSHGSVKKSLQWLPVAGGVATRNVRRPHGSLLPAGGRDDSPSPHCGRWKPVEVQSGHCRYSSPLHWHLHRCRGWPHRSCWCRRRLTMDWRVGWTNRVGHNPAPKVL